MVLNLSFIFAAPEQHTCARGIYYFAHISWDFLPIPLPVTGIFPLDTCFGPLFLANEQRPCFCSCVIQAAGSQ